MTEPLIIGLLISILVAVIFLIILYTKDHHKNNNTVFEQKDIQNELKLHLQKEYGDLKFEIQKLFGEYSKSGQTDLTSFKSDMIEHIDKHLKAINEKVDLRLGLGFEKTQETFVNVEKRLTKIDEAQKKIEHLSEEVLSLNDILTDKKTRGVFGEVQLYQLLSNVMGNHKYMYEKQKKLSNDAIADAILYAPDPLGMIAIDSKFPLNNYKKMTDKSLSEIERTHAQKDFKNDVKKHINDIKSKYIIHGETSDQAILFIPAEAIFAEIIAYHEEVVEYANKQKIWLTSPTTLISTLTMIQMIVKNIERDQQAQLIIEELNKLGEDFNRYIYRWDKLKRSIESVSTDVKNVHISSAKISKRFQNISETQFDQIIDDELTEDVSSKD